MQFCFIDFWLVYTSFFGGRKLPKWTMHFCCVLYFTENRGYVCSFYWIVDTLLICLDVIVIVIKQKIVDGNFCLFIIFAVLLVDYKTGKSLTYDWLNSMFLFLLCYSNVCYAGVLHSTDVIFVVKVHVRIVLFLGNQLMLWLLVWVRLLLRCLTHF